ncbi:UPF0605 protein CG18335-like [Phymastichus coffea]|uniref:UPF0605 protein CG18335-like n=1 Tax=Phymastichus coffea TaxID=108790 RepID=UPI00273ABF58|nr:UPF0605 protein CG18335-like [Phymastichus coffea]
MVGIEILQKNQPHYLPGYTGYCPQNRFICGDSYANASHQLLLDPMVNHADKLVLTDNTKNYEVTKPKKRDIKTVNSRFHKKRPIYKHPMLSSYDGFIPNLDDLKDKPFGAHATEGIAAFERQQLKRKASRDCLKQTLALQSGRIHLKNMEDQLLLQNKSKLPLTELRPERIGIEKNYFIDETSIKTKDHNASPYFMGNTDPQKYFISGYTGYVPNSPAHFGKPFKRMSTDGLRDFTSHYLNKKRVEWVPLIIPSKKTETLSIPTKIYQIHLKDTPLMPSYTGHVPGIKYEIGKTYGYLSKNANQYIQDQLFSLAIRKCYK